MSFYFLFLVWKFLQALKKLFGLNQLVLVLKALKALKLNVRISKLSLFQSIFSNQKVLKLTNFLLFQTLNQAKKAAFPSLKTSMILFSLHAFKQKLFMTMKSFLATWALHEKEADIMTHEHVLELKLEDWLMSWNLNIIPLTISINIQSDFTFVHVAVASNHDAL